MDWVGLPHNLLDDILKKLESPRDYIRFGAVCISWRSAWEFNNVKRNALSRHHYPPMLMITSRDDERVWHSYNVASKEFIGHEVYVPHMERFRLSSHGWLLDVGHNWSVTLYRPFSENNADMDRHAFLQLPNISFICADYSPVFQPYTIHKAVISADPVTNSNECVVLLVDSRGVSFIRPGRDLSWTRLSGPDYQFIADVVILNGNRVYAVKESKGAMISFELSNLVPNVDEVASGIPLCPSIEGEMCMGRRYLVKSPCSDDLLQIERFIGMFGLRYTKSFRVFRFSEKEKVWVRVKKLEDTCLFVGNSSSISIRCSMFSEYRSNCVYFTHDTIAASFNSGDGPSPYSDLGIYDLETNKFEFHYSLDHIDFATISRIPIWVVQTA